jgi:hypothetical protein
MRRGEGVRLSRVGGGWALLFLPCARPYRDVEMLPPNLGDALDLTPSLVNKDIERII